jgi:hypothetical protein
MPTDSCRVIVNCFLDGRSSRNNSPPNKISGLNFLKKIVETESNIESNTKYDLIILNHNTDYLIGNEYIDSINNIKQEDSVWSKSGIAKGTDDNIKLLSSSA